MSPRLAAVVLLHDVHGIAVPAIAKALRITAAEVLARLRNGRHQLLRHMKS
jgi:DNA-directed RNA polymerase specialized sigma24 family protein